MLVTKLKSKIAYAKVTQTELFYVGSITIDENIMKRAALTENEKVQVVNINNGSRIETYVIKGEAGSGIFALNGPAARHAQVGDDFHINPEEIESKYFGVLTKLFNVARFASQFEVPQNLDSLPENLSVEDRWILAEFAETMDKVEDAWTNLDIYTATQALKTFGTGILPSHWLEMSKSRLYDGDTNAAWTIHRIVRDLMSALSPVCPFFTHHISSTLYEQSAVDVREFPNRTPDDGQLRKLTNEIEEFNGSTWRKKKDSGLSLNAPISGITIPEELSEFNSILTQMHKLE